MFCAKCGAEVEDSEEYCNRCGYEIKKGYAKTSIEEITIIEDESKGKKNNNIIFYCIISSITVLCLIIIILFSKSYLGSRCSVIENTYFITFDAMSKYENEKNGD